MRYQTVHNRIHSCRGVSRLAFILIVLAAVMFVAALGIPGTRYLVTRSRAYGCGSALATANDQLKIYYLMVKDQPTADEAKAEVTRVMDGWDDLCPGGGDCYIVDTDDADVPYRVVCALHDDDADEAALLNAQSALRQVLILTEEDALAAQEEIPVTLNSRDCTAVPDETETIPYPTRTELRKAGGAMLSYHAEDGRIVWFCYVGSERTCVWEPDEAYTGTDDIVYGGWTVRGS